MDQSKVESFVEASMNVFTGFFISLAVWMFVAVPILDIPIAPHNSIIATLMITVTSIARSYLIRRFFNTSWDNLAANITKRIHKWFYTAE